MNILFTICGRAGSKGFKNKNLKIFLGKPLVYYTMAAVELYIEKYNTSDTIHKCLNTDSKGLIDLVTRQGSDYFIINRDGYLSGDTVAKMAVIKDCLIQADVYYNISHDIVIDLDMTSPLRTVNNVYQAVEYQKQNMDMDVVFSVTNARRNPYFNMIKQNADGTVSKVCESNYTARQQTPTVFDMNASIYVYKSDFLKNNNTNRIFDGKCGVIKMYDTAILDIDSEEDFVLMEIIAKYLYDNKIEFNQIYAFYSKRKSL
jgi:CMP-N,N'-diacetyllegionaminic acid synthase